MRMIGESVDETMSTVKHEDVRCTTHWRTGTITHIHSSRKVDVDRMPRHIRDVRPLEKDSSSDREGRDIEEMNERRYPSRPSDYFVPCYLDDPFMDQEEML